MLRIVAVKADASVQHIDKRACRKNAFWSSIHEPYDHIADVLSKVSQRTYRIFFDQTCVNYISLCKKHTF